MQHATRGPAGALSVVQCGGKRGGGGGGGVRCHAGANGCAQPGPGGAGDPARRRPPGRVDKTSRCVHPVWYPHAIRANRRGESLPLVQGGSPDVEGPRWVWVRSRQTCQLTCSYPRGGAAATPAARP